MDEILLRLMHVPRGLRVTPEQLVLLLKGEDPARVFFDGYFLARPHWREESQRELEACAQRGIVWSCVGRPDYPRGWLGLSQRPLVFHYRGRPRWRDHRFLAVVGSRTAMIETRLWMQRELSEFLRLSGAGLVSGGAVGIDSLAHRLSLDEGRPTLCVLPSGVSNAYPREHSKLFERIVEAGGCVLSTFSSQMEMRKHHFHTRNRWIVGLACAVFVAQANRRSGSALTATLAESEGREIATLPVFPHSEQGMGNLDLLSAGATMIRHHADLKTFWDRNKLCPALLEGLHGESEKDGVHQPEAHVGGQPTVARETFGGDVTDPVGDQQS